MRTEPNNGRFSLQCTCDAEQVLSLSGVAPPSCTTAICTVIIDIASQGEPAILAFEMQRRGARRVACFRRKIFLSLAILPLYV
jgi:hypothetical protein